MQDNVLVNMYTYVFMIIALIQVVRDHNFKKPNLIAISILVQIEIQLSTTVE